MFSSPTITALLPQFILIGTGLLFLLGGQLRRAQKAWGPICLATMLLAGICLAVYSQPVAQLAPEIDSSATNAVQSQASSDIIADQLSFEFQKFILLFGTLFTLMAYTSQSSSPTAAEHYGLLLFIVAGTMLVGLANDLIVLFLTLEFTGLSIVALLFRSQSRKADKSIVIQQLILQMLTSAIILYGLSLLFGLSASTNLSEIQNVFQASFHPSSQQNQTGMVAPLGVAAMLLLSVGLGFWISLVPFQFLQVDLYTQQNIGNCTLLSVIPKSIGLLLFARLLVDTMPGFEQSGQLLTTVLACITMLYGSMMALRESKFCRLLFFTTIGQTGFALIGIAAAFQTNHTNTEGEMMHGPFPDGITATMYYLLSYSLAVVGFFAVLKYFSRPDRELEYIDELKGLSRTNPIAAITAVICLCSFVGLPPFAGFWGRWLILTSALSSQSESAQAVVSFPIQIFVVVALIAVVHIVLTATVCLRVISVILLDEPIAQPAPAGGRPALAAALIAAMLILLLGLFPTSLFS